MLNFVDIEEDIAFQDRNGYADELFGTEIALKSSPLDFIYESDEVSISSFSAVKIESNGNDSETFTLSTSLISASGTQHICNGLTDYAEDLTGGIYYFLVNDRYKSESFTVLEDLIAEVSAQPSIAVSGLSFIDNTIDIAWNEKSGSPWPLFGSQYTENSNPLPFVYNAIDSVSTFVAVRVDTSLRIISETVLATDLISSNGSQHACNGLTNFTTWLNEGIYYFVVNDRYESDIFLTLDLSNGALLLETGFKLLLETGFKLLLEDPINPDWILADGTWDDDGTWIDSETWIG